MSYQVDIELLKKLYYEDILSGKEVAVRMGLPEHVIYATMRKHGLERRSKSESQKLRTEKMRNSSSTQKMARLYFDEKKTLKETGEEFGVTDACVRSRLLAAGYKVRSPYEARVLSQGGRKLVVFSDEEKEQIRNSYCEDGDSLATIAFRYSVSPQIISRTLDEMGVVLRTIAESQRLRREKEDERNREKLAEKAGELLKSSEISESVIVKLRNEMNMKIDEIAVKCSMTNMEVYQILQQAGYLSVV